MSQMKGQNKTQQEELNRVGTRDLLDAEFKTLAVRMLNELNENLKSVKNDQ